MTELGEQILEKLIAAGITTVEELADMTPEQLEEVPGIGEKTVEKISTAVRHYFGHYEEGEERPAPALPVDAETIAAASIEEGSATVEGAPEESGVAKTPEETLDRIVDENVDVATTSVDRTPAELLAEDASEFGEAQELNGVSTEDLADAEDRDSMSDANDEADAREEQIELNNDTVDELVDQAQEVSDEGIDTDGHVRG